MSEKCTVEEQSIVDNWGLVTRSIKVSEVVDHMIEGGFIQIEEWMELKEKNISEKEKVGEFLHLIMKRRNPMALPCLQHSLRLSNHKALADRLNITDVWKSSSTDHHHTEVNGTGSRKTQNTNNEMEHVRKTDLAKMVESLQKVEATLKENTNEIKQLREEQKRDRIDFRKEIHDLKCKMAENQDEYQSTKLRNYELKSKLKKYEQDCKDLQLEAQDTKDENQILQEEKIILKHEIDKLTEEVESLEKDLIEAEIREKAAKSQVTDRQKLYAENQKQKRIIDELGKRKLKLDDALKLQKREIEALTLENQQLEERLKTAEKNENSRRGPKHNTRLLFSRRRTPNSVVGQGLPNIQRSRHGHKNDRGY